jgi:hypothetical protein
VLGQLGLKLDPEPEPMQLSALEGPEESTHGEPRDEVGKPAPGFSAREIPIICRTAPKAVSTYVSRLSKWVRDTARFMEGVVATLDQ